MDKNTVQIKTKLQSVFQDESTLIFTVKKADHQVKRSRPSVHQPNYTTPISLSCIL